MDKAGVGFCLNSRVCEIRPDGIRYEQNGETKEMTGFDSMSLLSVPVQIRHWKQSMKVITVFTV
ncbi:MAG: hypothetical protein ACLT4E_13210 [Clostridium sp.]